MEPFRTRGVFGWNVITFSYVISRIVKEFPLSQSPIVGARQKTSNLCGMPCDHSPLRQTHQACGRHIDQHRYPVRRPMPEIRTEGYLHG